MFEAILAGELGNTATKVKLSFYKRNNIIATCCEVSLALAGRPVTHGTALRGLLASRVFVSTSYGLLMTHRIMFQPRGCVLGSARPRNKNVVSARTNFRKALNPPEADHPPPCPELDFPCVDPFRS